MEEGSGKQDGFVWDDVLAFGKVCNLRESPVREITRDIADSLSCFEQTPKRSPPDVHCDSARQKRECRVGA